MVKRKGKKKKKKCEQEVPLLVPDGRSFLPWPEKLAGENKTNSGISDPNPTSDKQISANILQYRTCSSASSSASLHLSTVSMPSSTPTSSEAIAIKDLPGHGQAVINNNYCYSV